MKKQAGGVTPEWFRHERLQETWKIAEFVIAVSCEFGTIPHENAGNRLKSQDTTHPQKDGFPTRWLRKQPETGNSSVVPIIGDQTGAVLMQLTLAVNSFPKEVPDAVLSWRTFHYTLRFSEIVAKEWTDAENSGRVFDCSV